MDGGDGLDTLNYASSASAVTGNLAAGTASGGAGNDSFTGFENVMGSSVADSIIGNSANNIIEGGLGNDTMDGGDGLDTLSYSSATSAITVNLSAGTSSGGAGIDSFTGFENIIGSSAADSIIGNTANNTIEGGLGNDTMDGGVGIDTLSYALSPSAVTVNLSLNTASGGAGNDSFAGFEIVLGSSAADTFICEGSGSIMGGLGDDSINNPAAIILDFQSASSPLNLGLDSILAGGSSAFGITAINYPSGTSCAESVTGINSVLTLSYSGGTISVLNITSSSLSSAMTCSNIIWS